MASSGITYRHFPELGGCRVNPETLAASSNDAWPEGFLRNYADYAMTDAFQGALDRLTATLQPRSVLMCAEKQWGDCHRQIVADHLISSGHHLVHLIEAHMHEAATLTPFATRCAAGTICYPAAHAQLRLDL